MTNKEKIEDLLDAELQESNKITIVMEVGYTILSYDQIKQLGQALLDYHKTLENKNSKKQSFKKYIKKPKISNNLIEKVTDEMLFENGLMIIPAHHESCHICDGKDMNCKSCGGAAPTYIEERIVKIKDGK